MTLLESVVAFMLLAVVGVACLDLSRGASGLESRSAEWSRAVAVGDAALTAAAAGERLEGDAWREVRVERAPWRDGTQGVDILEVTVALPGGETFRTMRLVPRPGARVTPAGRQP